MNCNQQYFIWDAGYGGLHFSLDAYAGKLNNEL